MGISSGLFITLSLATVTQAQVAPDGTLNTAITQSGLNYTITNGTAAGSNLFHSFQRFSVPTGGSATFDLVNTPSITTIFSRVTGSNPSNIDGLIRTMNSSNAVSLFLLNPSGILFGSNARLDIGGSFVGTTANGIQFTDGTEFRAVDSQTTPLLTISAPIGLQFSSSPAPITVQGTGHLLTTTNAVFAPFVPTGIHSGLAVQSGKTLAIVGGAVDLTGGVLTAPGGRVELGSVGQAGLVGLDPASQGFTLSYAKMPSFGTIQLSQQALVDVSGFQAGFIRIQGRQVSVTDGSVIWSQNRGVQPAGTIDISASEFLKLSGTTSNIDIPSSITAETVGLGGDITVSTPTLVVQAGAYLGSKTFGTTGGNVTVNASDITVSGFVDNAPDHYSVLASATVAAGRSGNVTLSTQRLSVLEGGVVGATTLGTGSSGNVTINADTVDVSGTTPALTSSLISSATLGAGNAGSLVLNTRSLTLRAGGIVTTASLGTGTAGNNTINAAELVDVSGRVPEGVYPSSISSTAEIPSLGLKQLYGLPDVISGASGDLTINTPTLKVSDGAVLTVSNKKVGNAGTLRVNAESILLNREGSIAAYTFSGEGGNIILNAQNLLLRQGSSLTATAQGTGNGGNININASIILGLENSDIVANAVQGRGGNIQITTQGIFGLKFRDRLTPDNDITASSQFGISGGVQITSPDVDPNSGLVELPVNVADPTQQIATGCSGMNESRFVATGRGGLPQNPTEQVTGDRPWSDLRDLSVYRHNPSIAPSPLDPSSVSPLEATGWRRNPNSQVELIAQIESGNNKAGNVLATCAFAP